jgi:phage major head subunit gpT-like protein
MLITQASIQTLQTTFSTIFRSGWTATDPKLIQVATVVPSSTRTNTYGWMARLLKMRQWDGPRVLQNLNTFAYILENAPYELTVGVDRDDISDDQLGVYNPLFDELGRQAKKWPDQVLKTVLQAGGTNLCFDGLPFFSASHPLNPAGAQANLFTSTALTAANFSTVRSTMMAYTGEDGEPLGVQPNLLIVSPTLEDTANQIVKANYNAAGATNVQMGQASVLVVPELGNQATVWYLADATHAIKPLVWQLRKAPEFVNKTEPTDDNVFFQRQFVWGVDARGAGGYGPWFLMAKAS